MSLSRTREGEPPPKVEINVVPLVDVALVLLIIFMVTATFVKTTGMRLQLPSSSSARPMETPKRELVIGIDREGRFSWCGTSVTDVGLADELKQEAAANGTRSRVTVQGDTRAEYGRVITAMTSAQEAGFTNLVVAMRPDTRTPQ